MILKRFVSIRYAASLLLTAPTLLAQAPDRSRRDVRYAGLLLLITPLLSAFPRPALSAPPPAPERVSQCESCHGKDGNCTDNHVPTIAGLSAEYIKESLNDFRHSARKGSPYKPEGKKETNMNEITKGLLAEDIDTLAAYFSSKKFVPRKQAFNPTLAEKGRKVYLRRCERCHDDNGRDTEDDIGRLAGQPMAYIKAQIEAFLKGERKPPKKMAKQLRKLKQGDVDRLVQFFAAQQ